MTSNKEKTYTVREINGHKTWYGIEYNATRAMQQYGYITKKSFESSATHDTPDTILQFEATGKYYRQEGS